MDWINNDTIPSGNKTIAIINQLVEKYGSLASGTGQRCSPSRNKALNKYQILNANRFLREAIILANSSYNFKYDTVTKHMKNAFGYGELGTQHVLSICTLFGLVKDIRYITHATIAKNTKTEKMYNRQFNINYKAMNGIYKELADNYFLGKTFIAENLGCEYLRDMSADIFHYSVDRYNEAVIDRKNRHPDSFHYSQMIYKVVGTLVIEYKYEKDSDNVVSNVHKLPTIKSNERCEWIDKANIIRDMEKIEYEITSKEQNKPKVKNVQKPKKAKSPKKTESDEMKSKTEIENTTKIVIESKSIEAFEDEPKNDGDEKIYADEKHPKKQKIMVDITVLKENYDEINLSEQKERVIQEEKDANEEKSETNIAFLYQSSDVSLDSSLYTQPFYLDYIQNAYNTSDEESTLTSNEENQKEVLDEVELSPVHSFQEFLLNRPEKITYTDIGDNRFESYINDLSRHTKSLVSINVNQEIRKIVGDRYARYGKGPKTKISMMDIQTIKIPFAGDVHTVIVRGETDHFVKMNSWHVYSEGFMGYYDLQVNGKVEMIAFYKDVRDAVKAVQIHCLTQVAKMHQPNDSYPEWVNRYIRKRENIEIADESHPTFNGIVFVSKLHQKRKFFGYLDLDWHKLRLMIPVDDSENLTIPWQDFYFQNNRV